LPRGAYIFLTPRVLPFRLSGFLHIIPPFSIHLDEGSPSVGISHMFDLGLLHIPKHHGQGCHFTYATDAHAMV
jgi:hypothetical protein